MRGLAGSVTYFADVPVGSTDYNILTQLSHGSGAGLYYDLDNVEAIKGKYAGDYDYHGAKLSEGVKEVVWSGGKLADDNYDEFVFSTFLTGGLKPNTMLYFPVVQECEQGVSRWIDIPAAGQSGHGHDSKTPAPGLKLTTKP